MSYLGTPIDFILDSVILIVLIAVIAFIAVTIIKRIRSNHSYENDTLPDIIDPDESMPSLDDEDEDF